MSPRPKKRVVRSAVAGTMTPALSAAGYSMEFSETAKFCDVLSREVASQDVCPALQTIGALDVGVTHVTGEWCFVRLQPAFALVLVGISGEGSVIVDGKWQEIGPQTAYVMPAGQLHGYRVAGDKKNWRYVWVRLQSEARFAVLFQSGNAHCIQAAAYSLLAANQGLIAEVERSKDPHLVSLWCELIQSSLHHLSRPTSVDPRLANLWSHVNERLSEPWDVQRLARQIQVSEEHLRRLCHRYYGCSPRQRLTILRLRRACEYLQMTDGTLALIAQSIGFSDAFSFSQAFKRVVGVSPSAYRVQARESGPAAGLA